MIPGLKIRHFLSAGSFPSYLSSPENQLGSEGELLDPPGVLGGGGGGNPWKMFDFGSV